jgi:hypothetical protein
MTKTKTELQKEIKEIKKKNIEIKKQAQKDAETYIFRTEKLLEALVKIFEIERKDLLNKINELTKF